MRALLLYVGVAGALFRQPRDDPLGGLALAGGRRLALEGAEPGEQLAVPRFIEVGHDGRGIGGGHRARNPSLPASAPP